jgi:hypothetical protein
MCGESGSCPVGELAFFGGAERAKWCLAGFHPNQALWDGSAEKGAMDAIIRLLSIWVGKIRAKPPMFLNEVERKTSR